MTPEQRERVQQRIAQAAQDAALASERLHALVARTGDDAPIITINALEDTCGALFHVASSLHDLAVALLTDDDQ